MPPNPSALIYAVFMHTSKKLTRIRDVMRYLHAVTVSKDGLLVVSQTDPLNSIRERIVVPRQVLHGLVVALHLKLDHPSSHQLGLAMRRYLFALDMDKAIKEATDTCHQCQSMKSHPTLVQEQSTSDPPPTVGCTFAADVIRRERQCIFVMRETVTSYTVTSIISDERHETLRDAIICSVSTMHPLDGPSTVVRTDPAPAFVSLATDDILRSSRISIEIGRTKNPNKNPVAEKAVAELETELKRQQQGSGPVTPVTLAIATARLNARIRSRGLSSREMWYQRDMFTNEQLPIQDMDLIQSQYENRKQNHPHSMK